MQSQSPARRNKGSGWNQLSVLIDLFNSVTRLKNARTFAKSFLDQEISRWLSEPRKVGELTIRIISPSAGSLFAQPTEGKKTKIEIRYQADMAVEVDGLFFKYKAGSSTSDRLMDFVEVDLSKIDPSKAVAAAISTTVANRLLNVVPDHWVYR